MSNYVSFNCAFLNTYIVQSLEQVHTLVAILFHVSMTKVWEVLSEQKCYTCEANKVRCVVLV